MPGAIMFVLLDRLNAASIHHEASIMPCNGHAYASAQFALTDAKCID